MGHKPVPKLYPLQTVLEGKPRPCHFSEAAVVKILREVPIPVDELGGAKFGDLIGVLNRFLILPCWKSDASPKIPGTCLSAGSWLLNNDMLSWSHCPTKHRRRGDQSFATLMSSFFFWEATVCHISVQPCLVFCRKRCLKDIWYQQNYTQVFVPKRTESSCGCVLEVPSEFWFTSLVFFSAPKKTRVFHHPPRKALAAHLRAEKAASAAQHSKVPLRSSFGGGHHLGPGG